MVDVSFGALGDWALSREAAIGLSNKLDDLIALSPAALEAHRSSRSRQSESLRTRQGIAIIDVCGPLFKRPNLFSTLIGASTYAGIMRDLQTALVDPEITGVLLNIDSPGGMVNGCDELAGAIYAARDRKQIRAYAGGQACSAAYWIASAAEELTLSPATEVGSIGVVASIQNNREADERRGVRTLEFVSSKAPNKHPDPETGPGRKVIQTRVDALASVFVAAVARHRGVSVERVNRDFGAGDVRLGAAAVKLGMADAVGSFEDVFAQMRSQRPAAETPPVAQTKSITGKSPMTTAPNIQQAVATAIRQLGPTASRAQPTSPVASWGDAIAQANGGSPTANSRATPGDGGFADVQAGSAAVLDQTSAIRINPISALSVECDSTTSGWANAVRIANQENP